MIVDQHGNEYFVFDDHTHMGMRPNRTLIAPAEFGLEQMIGDMDAAGVDMAVAFPRANPHTDYRVENERVIGYAEAAPDRIVPYLRVQPYFMEAAVEVIAEFAERGARGLKLHPFMDTGGNVINHREMFFPLMEEVAKHDLVVIIHSGEGWNTTPALIGDLADHFPSITFIIAHSGLWEYHQEAIVTARRLQNIYLDTAEVGPPPVITNVVRGVGADRVLYGSDRPAISFEAEICKVAKYADLAPDEIRKVLGENLAKLLDIPIRLDGRKRVELASI